MPAETILVVDDSDTIRHFLCRSVLEPEGYRVLSASNGIVGLEMIAQHQPDLLMVDINMPGKSGLEVLEYLSSTNSELPVIIITSYGSEDTILKTFRLGAKDFLQKPFTQEEALQSVARALAESRWQRERVRMNKELVQANQRLQQQIKAWADLNTIGQAITSTLEEKDVQRRLMWGINHLMHVEAGSLYLIDEDSGDLVLQISLGERIEKQGGLRMKPGQGIAGWVAQHNQPALVPDVHTDSRFYNAMDQKSGFETHSMLAVPLVVQERVLGVIQVLNPLGAKQQFDLADQKLLEALAASVAVAVENSRLHAKTRQAVSHETIQKTVVTLSHYLYNYLMALKGNLVLLQENLQRQEAEADLLQLLAESLSSANRIQAVLQVLQRTSQVKQATYTGQTQMIDIESALRKELANVLGEGHAPVVK